LDCGRVAGRERTSPLSFLRPTVSIIIPALNEAACIGATLHAVAQLSGAVEVLLVDGDSDDDTCEIARAAGAKVISAARGRGVQLQRGAREALGDVLWFLHADTIVPLDGVKQIAEALSDPAVVAGNFNLHFSGSRRAARFMTWFYPQLRHVRLCYGDSAIFVRREAYDRVGGFKALPIFEDLDLIRNLRSIGKFVHLSSTVTTSSRRFEQRSFVLIFSRWVLLQSLYWLGVSPRRLARLYAPSTAIRRKTRASETID
jgi:rSAM/selenodomain-associated transferase 2